MSEIDAILERGRPGVDVLARYVQLAQRIAQTRFDVAHLVDLFDAERTISLESVRECRSHVLSARAALADSVRVQADIAESLDGVLDTGAQSGTRLLERLDSLIVALSEAVEEIPDVVALKAARIAALDADIDGRTADECDDRIEAARRQESESLTWTEYVFLPAVDARIDRFVAACDDSRADIDACFGRLANALRTDRPADAAIVPQAGPR